MAKSRLLIVPVAALSLLAVSGCGEDTFTADITLTSSTPVTLDYVEGGECGGMGNDAMDEGKPWKIKAGGETIAMGELPAGVGVQVNPGPVDCFFQFTAEIPAGHDFYTLDMGERQGYIEVSREKLEEGFQIDRVDLDGRY
ncbi:hypothetical protein [Arthrobacter caoxuetaonis]|uniref:Lipoprotein n=1 Tax=Arthrobacter caoxuetaonis TaxID=2886935 RepID=A0A9X1MHH0_9MICC|nr:hypothetical protein [Arthrobacter caoxuetaonis]MCC3299701.1 hypothetical protein [Arthrobacter caoxuetaonis]USQ59397.1 hypothetical protein NF551_17785 [Arthrobacter caoxuetaonis]